MEREALRSEATRWQMRHGGLSGRTAQQFIDHLLGQQQA
jgi:predicted AAA+ superfamily ATPase